MAYDGEGPHEGADSGRATAADTRGQLLGAERLKVGGPEHAGAREAAVRLHRDGAGRDLPSVVDPNVHVVRLVDDRRLVTVIGILRLAGWRVAHPDVGRLPMRKPARKGTGVRDVVTDEEVRRGRVTGGQVAGPSVRLPGPLQPDVRVIRVPKRAVVEH